MKDFDWTALQLFGEEAVQEAEPEEAQEVPDGQEPSGAAARFRSHMEGLLRQEAALKAAVPGFALRQELKNPMFARLTSPRVGLSLEDAFYAVHRREIQQHSMRLAAQRTRSMMSNAIQSGTHRPQEAGAQSPALTRFDYRKATQQQRQALKQEIRKAAAEGRKVYPG